MQFINVIYTNQQIFHAIIFLLTNVILIMWVLKPSAISNQRWPLESCWVKKTFLSDEQHLIFYFLRTREGHMPTITVIRRGLPSGQSLSSGLERDHHRRESSREFRYSWLGLFNCWVGHKYPVPSSPLHDPRSGAHWPNRMEYFTTSPLETKLYRLSYEQFFKRLFCSFSFGQWFNISSKHFTSDGSTTFRFIRLQGIHTEMVVTIRTHYTGCFSNSMRHIAIYFNWHGITQYITQIRHINSLCSTSNSLRVPEQLILGCPNSSEPNSSEHNKSWSAPRHLVYWL